MDSTDVTIIGAGVSGLTCARHLLARGFKVKILEARNRVGGRAYSAFTDDRLPHPPEYGAEFIHGASPAFLNLLQELKCEFVDTFESHLFLKNRKLVRKNDFWQQLEKLMNRLNPHLKSDRTIAEFLKVHGNKVSPDIRTLFKAYVEGFQAADIAVMSEAALALNEQGEEASLGGVELFRLNGGYSAFIEKLLASDRKLKSATRLLCTVKEVRWSDDEAIVSFLKGNRQSRLRSRVLIITLPVGVLKAPDSKASITFHPPLTKLDQALQSVHTGHVQRITFEFQTRFWEKLSKEPVSFLHAGSEHFFPTWWSQLPVRSPYFIAWQGGPKAYELSLMPEAQRVELALKTLSKITGKNFSFLKKQLLRHYTHDWSNDPFSLGAYSYNGVDAQNKLAILQRPLAKSIIYAGEATANGPAQGTIHGAQDSGLRAAKQAEKLLNN